MTGPFRAVVVPPVPALLPQYASIVDPVAELRSAATASVAWLVDDSPPDVTVVWSATAGGGRRADSEALGPVELRVARSLLDTVGYGGALVAAERRAADHSDPVPGRTPYLVLANGCAEPAVRQPAPPDPRCAELDTAIDRALRTADAERLLSLDIGLGDRLSAAGARALHALGTLVAQQDSPATTTVRYDAAPYLIRYWVAELHAG